MITKIIAEEKIVQVKKLIEKHDDIVIICHVSPDGDAVGASLGLYHLLCELEKNVTIIAPDAIPDNLRFLSGTKDILYYNKYAEFADELISKAELIFCLDFNALSRIGDMKIPVLEASAKKIMIDHHLDPENFNQIAISYPEISSTSEMIFRLICRMGMFDMVTVDCGSAIYTGMMTDTGNFTYNSNKAEIYFIIGELVKKGVDKDSIYSKVFNTNSLDKVRLNGYAVSEKLDVFSAYKAAMITLTREELNRYNYQKGDSEGLVNVPLGIEGIVFCVFFREEKEYIKVSLRSKGSFPVNKMAAEHFNGGGHLNASGGEFYGTMEEAKSLFIHILPDYAHYLEV